MATDFERIIREAIHNVFVKEGLLPREIAAKSVPAMGMTPVEDENERRREDDKIKEFEKRLLDEQRRNEQREERRRRRQARAVLGI